MVVLEEGDWVRETLEVERKLGEGAFASVFRIRDRLLQRRLALKLFKTAIESVDELEEKLHEARLVGSFDHRNILSIFDAGILDKDDRRWGYFTMEYVAGGDLDSYWRSFAKALMPVAETVDISFQITRALAVAHAQKPAIIHRDIKPQNIMIGYDGGGQRAVLGDFGLAKSVSPLTLLASAQGTLEFKAPEAFEDQDSTAGDIWSLGVTMYLLLTDHFPHKELGGRGLGNAKDRLRPLKSPSHYNYCVDAELDRIVSKCLSVDPAARYKDASALASDLGAWRPDNPEKARAPGKSDFEPDIKTLTARVEPTHELDVMIREAFNLAKDVGRLDTAADILEQAIICKPELREKYGRRLKQWRQGVWM
jgi:serine/threonine-protein kinase